MSSPKLKILLSAFACHPNKGSEEGIGWNWLKELSREHKIHVIIGSYSDQEKAVKKAVSQLDQKENIHLTFIPSPESPNGNASPFSLFDFYVSHIKWQKKAFQEAEKILERVDIDIVHHVTYASWLTSGFLYKLPKPFILGPVSGSQKIPWFAYSFLPLKGKISELIRMFYFVWSRLFSPAAKESVRRADVVLCSNLETLSEINNIRGSNEAILFSDTGAPYVSDISPSCQDRKNREIILLWSGLVQPRKNFGLLLESLKILPKDISWKLYVLGGGDFIPYWEKKALKAKLDQRIFFLGHIPYEKMDRYYKEADIFVFPSLREGTPTAILEAMAYGLPVVALKLHGAATVLADSCGILVNVINRSQMIDDFAKAIVDLSRDSELRKEIGRTAKQKIQSHYTWENRKKRMLDIYEKVFEASKLDNK
jgi:glycosyltransferase involved in cell wall biosynthesis